VLSSSNAGSLTNFSTGSQNVFLTYPSERSVNLSSAALTSGRVAYATTDGLLTDSAGLTWDGSFLTATSIKDTALTSGRVTYAGASGLLSDSANLTFNGNTLSSSNATGANAIFNSTNNIPYIRFDESGASKLLIGASAVVGGGSGYDFYGATGIGYTFFTNAARRLDITSAGLVGIGTSSPTALLTLGGVAATGYTSFLANGTTTAYNLWTLNNTGGDLRIGIESATAVGILTGSTNYSACIGTLTANNLHLGTNSTVRATITSAGNVGIGTSSPLSALDVRSANATIGNYQTIQAFTTNTATIDFGGGISFGGNYSSTTSIAQFGTISGRKENATDGNYAGYLQFGTNSQATGVREVMRIDSSGNVGIGNTPTAKLDVATGDGTANANAVYFRGTTGVFAIYPYFDATIGCLINSYNSAISAYKPITFQASSFAFNPNGTERMRIDSSGNVGIGTSSPSSYGKFAVVGSTTQTSAFVAGGTNAFSLIYATSTSGTMYLGVNGTAAGTPIDIGDISDNATYFGSRTNTVTQLISNNTVRATIGTSGNVGIGTAPLTMLHLQRNTTSGTASVYPNIRIDNPNGAGYTGLYFYQDTTTQKAGFEVSNASGDLQFLTSSERMRITSAGNVGIGTSSPSYKLDVQNTGSGAATMHIQGSGLAAAFDNAGGNVTEIDLWNNGSQRATWYWNAGVSLTYLTSTTGGLAFSTNGNDIATERMRIDSSGNVSIGGFAPNAWSSGYKALQFSDATGAFVGGSTYGLQLGSNAYINSSSVWVYGGGSYGAARYEQFNGGHNWYRSTSTPVAGNNVVWSQAMTLDNAGNLLLGTTSALNTSIFTVAAPSSRQGSTFQAASASYWPILCWNADTATPSSLILFQVSNGTTVGSITYNGTLTLYNTTSDQRLKTNIVNAPVGNIDAIKVRSFDWIVDGSHQDYGMVAQELIEVAPYAVNKPENPDEMMGVDYSKLVPMMIKEIQDLKQRIATLENK
jgi:hypothetical protein